MRLSLISITLFSSLLCLGGCESDGDTTQNPEEEVRFAGGAEDVTLAGTLSFPSESGRFPGVLLISGSGPSDRNESIGGLQPFQVLADALNARGYAVLRHDDRGVGESSGDFASATVDDFAADAIAGLNFLASDPRIRTDCLVMIGHSEGGYVAPIAAAGHSSAALVLLAGAAQTMPEIVLDQQLHLAYPDRDPDQIISLFGAINDIVRWGEAYVEMGRQIDGLLVDAGLDEQDRQFYVSMFASPWWKRYLEHDPAYWLQRQDRPVLALYGDKDVQVRAEPNAALMSAYLMSPLSRVETFAGLNHLFQEAVTGMPEEYLELPGEVFDPVRMLPVMFEWLESVLPDGCA